MNVEVNRVGLKSCYEIVNIHLNLYNFYVRLYVIELLLNSWTDFDEMYCVCSSEFGNGLDSEWDLVRDWAGRRDPSPLV